MAKLGYVNRKSNGTFVGRPLDANARRRNHARSHRQDQHRRTGLPRRLWISRSWRRMDQKKQRDGQ